MANAKLVSSITALFRELNKEQKQMLNLWADKVHHDKITTVMFSDNEAVVTQLHDELDKALKSKDWSFFSAGLAIPNGQAAPVAAPVVTAPPAPEPVQPTPVQPTPVVQEQPVEKPKAEKKPKASQPAQPTEEDPLVRMMGDRLLSYILPTVFAQIQQMQPDPDGVRKIVREEIAAFAEHIGRYGKGQE